MRVDYPQRIAETVNELAALEKRLRGEAVCDRVKMLRLLKSGAYASRRPLAPVLGYSERQLQRWWKAYEKGGLSALLDEKPVGGSQERVTPEVVAGLQRERAAGRLPRLKDVQAYLQQRHGIAYHSLQGVADMLQRHRIGTES